MRNYWNYRESGGEREYFTSKSFPKEIRKGNFQRKFGTEISKGNSEFCFTFLRVKLLWEEKSEFPSLPASGGRWTYQKKKYPREKWEQRTNLETLPEFFGAANSEGQSHGNGRSQEIFQGKIHGKAEVSPKLPLVFVSQPKPDAHQGNFPLLGSG